MLSEYHAIGSCGGVTMLRKGRWKYVHYVNYRPQLFDLHSDPQELVDIAGKPENAATLATLKAELSRFCDPELVARANRRRRTLARYGGREASCTLNLNYTLAPGQAPTALGMNRRAFLSKPFAVVNARAPIPAKSLRHRRARRARARPLWPPRANIRRLRHR